MEERARGESESVVVLIKILDDKIIITNPIGENWYETNTYQLSDGEMTLWLARKNSYSEQDATNRHNAEIRKYTDTEQKYCKYCNQIAYNYDWLMNEWLCNDHFNKYIREKA